MLILPMQLGAFQPPRPAPGRPTTVFPWGREQEQLASCYAPAAPSTFSAATQARFTLASPATCICASCNIRRGKLEGFTAAYGCKRLLYFEGYQDIASPATTGSSTSSPRAMIRLAMRTAIAREKQCMKRCTRDHQVRTAAGILFSGFGGRKASSSMGKISTVGVLRLRATSAASPDKSVRRSAQRL